jgi:hypothetical protein
MLHVKSLLPTAFKTHIITFAQFHSLLCGTTYRKERGEGGERGEEEEEKKKRSVMAGKRQPISFVPCR